mmetsp:Transcript_4187/g.12371  ORF Transcript_4187/g.12371 Transcript_4187/m.12371 type:complete len:262 (-) Transcript_4187:1531-2316(-)
MCKVGDPLVQRPLFGAGVNLRPNLKNPDLGVAAERNGNVVHSGGGGRCAEPNIFSAAEKQRVLEAHFSRPLDAQIRTNQSARFEPGKGARKEKAFDHAVHATGSPRTRGELRQEHGFGRRASKNRSAQWRGETRSTSSVVYTTMTAAGRRGGSRGTSAGIGRRRSSTLGRAGPPSGPATFLGLGPRAVWSKGRGSRSGGGDGSRGGRSGGGGGGGRERRRYRSGQQVLGFGFGCTDAAPLFPTLVGTVLAIAGGAVHHGQR